jgi:hypothetical protein
MEKSSDFPLAIHCGEAKTPRDQDIAEYREVAEIVNDGVNQFSAALAGDHVVKEHRQTDPSYTCA